MCKDLNTHGFLQNTFCSGSIVTCATNWTFFPHTEKCYQYLNSGLILRTQAQAACANMSPAESSGSIIRELVSVPDANTYDFFVSLAGGNPTWLGGFRTENDEWFWSDGTAWNYTAWRHSEPNGFPTEKYVAMNWKRMGKGWVDLPDLGLWVMGHGGGVWGYICQYHRTGWFLC